LAVKKAQLLVADSRGVQEHLLATYGEQSVYIPYGTDLFTTADPSVLTKYKVQPQQYFLIVARMEPENNIELIIRGWLASNQSVPLFIIGNITNKFGRYLTANYRQPGILYSSPVYERTELDNLRHYAKLYFHGHSAGGTNPSLLEAMACGCRIAAHENIFNRAVLENEALYFSSENDVTAIVNRPGNVPVMDYWKEVNIEKIRTIYTHERITDAYEGMMLDAVKNKCVTRSHLKTNF
jgi:glycosyltransferase involved in cell wall biosynthesis